MKVFLTMFYYESKSEIKKNIFSIFFFFFFFFFFLEGGGGGES